MSQPKRVALVGGTGMLGTAVVEALLARPKLFELTLLTRRGPPSFKAPEGVKQTVVVESYDHPDNDEALVQALKGHDVLVSTLNSAVAVHCEKDPFWKES